MAQPTTRAGEQATDAPGATPSAALDRARRSAAWAADYAYAAAAHLAAPFAGRRSPRRWLAGDPGRPEILLLPGIYEHWSFLRPIAQRVHRAGYRVRTVHGLGVNRTPIPETADRLAAALARLALAPAGRIVVGHSKGGLIGKALLVRQEREGHAGGPGGGSDLLGVVAIASPFGGSRRARLLRRDPVIAEFLPDGPTILSLGGASGVNGRIVSIVGTYDPHVPDATELEGATNLLVPVSGHFRLLGARSTADAVLEGIALLEASEPARPPVPPE